MAVWGVRRADQYTEGEEYLIIAERYSSQFTIHDEYGVSAQLYLCPAEEKYTLFDEPLSWPEEQTFQEYILALHDTYGKETEEKSEIPDDWNVYEKVKGEADFIVLVTVDAISVEHESENRLSNAYSCALQEILVGDEKKLNFFGDGSLAIVMFKDQVEVGKTYICGISPVEKTSAIYLQTSREALFSREEKAQFTNE